eukprot:COSAG02_NODE_16930_length_1043_cov_1.470339_1_plen_87_part_10
MPGLAEQQENGSSFTPRPLHALLHRKVLHGLGSSLLYSSRRWAHAYYDRFVIDNRGHGALNLYRQTGSSACCRISQIGFLADRGPPP